ncbi:hypothetical protein WICMUC_004004 [Wickerhamomyces mucosus]|uniref:Regulator of rDNA transcription 14 n=1 Tax=Wickerhamomyces mucosus TaxID=1378264 RepID=A0A9P8PIX2_9ASCO|nr:hypothetical protein WICMUC_004004 [Wickerhamomyces mucosus]
MVKISFNNKPSTTSVNNLLNTVLPGHSISNSNNNSQLSNTEILNNAKTNNLKFEEIHKINKYQKLQKRKISQKLKKSERELASKIKFNLLKTKKKLNDKEQKEYKNLINDNIKGLIDTNSEDLKDIQNEILEIIKPKDKINRKNKKIVKQINLYKKKTIQHSFKGLTPGLAPVDLEDSDSDED